MLNNTKNTYACEKAITISRNVTQKTTNSGKIAAVVQINETELAANAIDQTKPINIFIKIWPDNMLAKRRTDKLTTLEK